MVKARPSSPEDERGLRSSPIGRRPCSSPPTIPRDLLDPHRSDERDAARHGSQRRRRSAGANRPLMRTTNMTVRSQGRSVACEMNADHGVVGRATDPPSIATASLEGPTTGVSRQTVPDRRFGHIRTAAELGERVAVRQDLRNRRLVYLPVQPRARSGSERFGIRRTDRASAVPHWSPAVDRYPFCEIRVQARGYATEQSRYSSARSASSTKRIAWSREAKRYGRRSTGPRAPDSTGCTSASTISPSEPCVCRPRRMTSGRSSLSAR